MSKVKELANLVAQLVMYGIVAAGIILGVAQHAQHASSATSSEVR